VSAKAVASENELMLLEIFYGIIDSYVGVAYMSNGELNEYNRCALCVVAFLHWLMLCHI